MEDITIGMTRYHHKAYCMDGIIKRIKDAQDRFNHTETEDLLKILGECMNAGRHVSEYDPLGDQSNFENQFESVELDIVYAEMAKMPGLQRIAVFASEKIDDGDFDKMSKSIMHDSATKPVYCWKGHAFDQMYLINRKLAVGAIDCVLYGIKTGDVAIDPANRFLGTGMAVEPNDRIVREFYRIFSGLATRDRHKFEDTLELVSRRIKKHEYKNALDKELMETMLRGLRLNWYERDLDMRRAERKQKQ